MDKTDYFYKMDTLVSDKQTYEELKRDPTPALLLKLNSKILTLKKTNAIGTQRYYRLRCSVPQPPKLCGLQSTENYIDAIKTVQIPDDYKLVSFDVKSLFTSIPLQLALQCTVGAMQQSTVTDRRHHGLAEPLPYIDLLTYWKNCRIPCHWKVAPLKIVATWPQS